MKRLTRTLALPLLALALLCTGCSARFDASAYVDALLRNIYLDDSTSYMKLVDVTAEEAHDAYIEGLEAESEVLFSFLSFDSNYISDETRQRVLDLYGQIYQHSKFEVEDAAKSGKGYTVVVRIYPIDIFEKAADEMSAYVDVFVEKIMNGDYADLSDEEVETSYQDGLLKILESKLSSIGNLDPIEQTVQIKEDTDGLWGMSDEDFQNLDTYIISYSTD